MGEENAVEKVVSHTCHAHGCMRKVPPAIFMCKVHWFSLRKPLRDAIWKEYRPGQEDDKKPSPRYLAVQRRAVGEVAFVPHNEEAALRSGFYLLESERWRRRAIEQGLGDPLEGLAPFLDERSDA